MGEIPHNTLLHEMRLWQVRASLRGHLRRGRTAWETTRMHAWMILGALGGKAESPTKLIEFPWEKKHTEIDEDEMDRVKALLKECKEYNEMHS